MAVVAPGDLRRLAADEVPVSRDSGFLRVLDAEARISDTYRRALQELVE